MAEPKSSTLLAALKLDEHPLVNEFMYVEEHSIADGCFLISSLIKHFLEQDKLIILVLCHNSEGHFQAISRKLGYNLMWSMQSGQICVLNVLERILNHDFYTHKNPLLTLYCDIKNQMNAWGSSKEVCVIVENLGNLMFVKMVELYIFVGYLRSVALQRRNCSVVCTVHDFDDCANFKIFTKTMRLWADLSVVLKSLESGIANDITGHLTVVRKHDKFQRIKTEYQYHLRDKTVTVFVPGSPSP